MQHVNTFKGSDLPGPFHVKNTIKTTKERKKRRVSIRLLSSKKAHQLLLQLLQKEEGRVNKEASSSRKPLVAIL